MPKLVGTLGFELFDPQLPGGKRGAVVVEPSPTLAFVLDYPLTTPHVFRRTHDDGPAGRGASSWAVVEAYRNVYLLTTGSGGTTWRIWSSRTPSVWRTGRSTRGRRTSTRDSARTVANRRSQHVRSARNLSREFIDPLTCSHCLRHNLRLSHSATLAGWSIRGRSPPSRTHWRCCAWRACRCRCRGDREEPAGHHARHAALAGRRAPGPQRVAQGEQAAL